MHCSKSKSGGRRPRREAARIVLLAAASLYLWMPGILQGADDDLPKAEELIEKYIEATGGLAAYDKIKNRVAETTLELKGQGIKMSMTIYTAKPCKLYTLIESEAIGRMERGTDGDVVWEDSVMMGPSVKEGKEREEFLQNATFDRLAYWRKVYQKAVCTGVETVDGRPCYKVLMTPKSPKPESGGKAGKDPKPHVFYYDQETRLLSRIDTVVETPMGPIPMEAYLGDYREVDGLRIAHKIRALTMGTERVATTKSIRHNVEIPVDRFNLPEAIQAIVDKKKKEKAGTPN